MGFPGGIIQGLTGAARGIRAGEQDRKDLEAQALREALQQRLLNTQIGDLSARTESRTTRAQQLSVLRQQRPDLAHLPDDQLAQAAQTLATRAPEREPREPLGTMFDVVVDGKLRKAVLTRGPDGTAHTEILDVELPTPAPKPPKPPTGAQDSAASFGMSMAQSHLGMQAIEDANPEAIQEIARFVRASRIAGNVPIIGDMLDEMSRAIRAPALSQDARQLITQLNSFVAASAPDRGGKQLTLAELRLTLDEILVDPGDDPATIATKRQNRLKRIGESRLKAGEIAWARAQELGGFTNEQLFGATEATEATGPTNPFSNHPWSR